LKRIKDKEDSRLYDKDQEAIAAEMLASTRAVEIEAHKKFRLLN
jgi:hypothetical protein